jgi:hypothetical protein
MPESGLPGSESGNAKPLSLSVQMSRELSAIFQGAILIFAFRKYAIGIFVDTLLPH